MSDETTDARAPHRITRAHVEREGHDAPQLLYAVFDLFNAEYFGGQLGAPLIWISEAGSPRAAGDYTAKDIHGLQSRIRIPPATYKHGLREVLGTLLHEMVHAWAHEVSGDLERGYKGHGPKFAAKCNAIGAQLGLPECAPKGRGGKRRAETWPHLPALEGEEVAPAKPSKPKPAATGASTCAPSAASDDDAARERAAVTAYLRAAAEQLAQRGHTRSACTLRQLAAAVDAGLHTAGSRQP